MSMTKTSRASRRRGRIVAAGEGRWRIRIWLGRNAAGRPMYVHKTVHGRKAEAEKVLTQLLASKDEHRLITPSRETLDSWIAEWLSTRRGSASVRTFFDYGQIFKRYLPPELRYKRLTAITP